MACPPLPVAHRSAGHTERRPGHTKPGQVRWGCRQRPVVALALPPVRSPRGLGRPVDDHRRTRGRPRKGACPPLRPPSYPHERAFGERLCGPSVDAAQAADAVEPEAGPVGQRSSGGRRRGRGPRTGRRRAAGSRRGRPSRRATRRRPSRRSRPRSPPCSRGRSGSRARGRARASRLRRPDPAALGELHVDARRRRRRARRGPRSVTALSSATIGSDERSWSQPRSRSSRRAGNGCSMSSTPSATSSGSRRSASSRVQPVLASTRIGPSKTRADRLERREVLRSAELDLERREVRRPGRPARRRPPARRSRS